MTGIDISCDRDRVDLDYCYDCISNSYWSMGRSRREFEKSVAMSLPVGAFCDGRQVGFARVVTDYIAIAYVADVFVDAQYRRRGIASQMINALHDHPDMQRVRRWLLATRDMQPLYRQHGYADLGGLLMMRLEEDAPNRPPLT
ncbi:MAG: GNAT family N-acetyltransferase [Pseudomonadota bacterium]